MEQRSPSIRFRTGGISAIEVILTVILVLALGGLVYWWQESRLAGPKPCTQEAKVCPDGTTVGRTGPNCEFAPCPAVPSDETVDWKIYRDEENGFELKYPADKFVLKAAEEGIPPSYQENAGGKKLVHSIPVQHCGPSGMLSRCRPETEDITIGFFVIGKSFVSIIAPVEKTFGGEVKEMIIGGKKAHFAETGAEGEGIFYYFLPLREATLMITRSYINENAVAAYKGAKDFIVFTEQEKLFNKVLATSKFISAAGNFSETGYLAKSEPGMEKDVWYLTYAKPGKRDLAVKLLFTGESLCQVSLDRFIAKSEICVSSDLRIGQQAAVTGKIDGDELEVDKIVTISK